MSASSFEGRCNARSNACRAIAVLDCKADPVERQTDQAPGAAEAVVDQQLRAGAGIKQLRAGLLALTACRQLGLGALILRTEVHHQATQHLGLEPWITFARHPQTVRSVVPPVPWMTCSSMPKWVI